MTMRPPRRRALLVLAASAALLAAGCGEEDATATGETAPGTVTRSPEPGAEEPGRPTEEAAEAEEPSEPAPDVPAIDGPPAPDFTLALADGGEFTLSAEPRPVYLIFWAEW